MIDTAKATLDEEKIKEQTLTVCPKCKRLGRQLMDTENMDSSGYFNIHFWHPDTDTRCYISRAIGLERAIDNELQQSPSGPQIPNNLNPRIYKDFLTEAKREGLSESQAWDSAMCLFLMQNGSGKRRHRGRPIQMVKHTKRIAAIPINIEADIEANKISLKEFYDEKLPQSHYERMTVIMYYLVRIAGIKYPSFGHIAYCYDRLNEKMPSIVDLAKNTERYKGYVKRRNKFTISITLEGTRFVESLSKNRLDGLTVEIEQ